MTDGSLTQEQLYERVLADYGAALGRLARGYEPDPHLREDLLQEIHLAIWLSLASYAGRCSLRTWAYRVAHNTAVSRVTRRRGRSPAFLSLDALAEASAPPLPDTADLERTRATLTALIQSLAPLERQIILLYLEELDAAGIAEIVGLSQGNVATKVHRIKRVLAQRFHSRNEP